MSEPIDNAAPDTAPANPPVPPVSGVWRRRLSLIGHFLAGQTLVQAINFLIGFLLLRWMDPINFAQYSVAWAFQSTVGSLVDLGFTSSIVALVGNRGNDPDVVGRYIRTARYFRTRSFLLVLTIATIAYPFVVWAQPWGWQIKVLLWVGIAAGLAAQNLIMYAAALLMVRQLKPYYGAQTVSGIARQTAYAVMYLTGTLVSWTASWVSAASIAIYGLVYRWKARPYVREPAFADPATNREMLRYIAPLMPGVIFTAFQSQISLAMITLFGKTSNIAEVGALGRLAQLFTLLAMFNSVLVEPYIARINREMLARRYLQVVVGQLLIGVALTLFAFGFPGVLLWLIGPNYAHLGREVGWIALTASISYVAGGLWVMNSARRWIYWWSTITYIVVLLVSQAASFAWLDMSRTHDVVLFGMISAAAVVVSHLAVTFYGFRFGPAPVNASGSVAST